MTAHTGIVVRGCPPSRWADPGQPTRGSARCLARPRRLSRRFRGAALASERAGARHVGAVQRGRVRPRGRGLWAHRHGGCRRFPPHLLQPRHLGRPLPARQRVRHLRRAGPGARRHRGRRALPGAGDGQLPAAGQRRQRFPRRPQPVLRRRQRPGRRAARRQLLDRPALLRAGGRVHPGHPFRAHGRRRPGRGRHRLGRRQAGHRLLQGRWRLGCAARSPHVAAAGAPRQHRRRRHCARRARPAARDRHVHARRRRARHRRKRHARLRAQPAARSAPGWHRRREQGVAAIRARVRGAGCQLRHHDRQPLPSHSGGWWKA